MTPREWIGKLIQIRDRRWRKPQLVRIIDVEDAPKPIQTNSEPIETWFWAKYA